MSIVVKANGGLGNRMRVLASCIALSQRLRKEVEVLWVNNYELNCPFDRLFMPIEGLRVHTKSYIPKWNKVGLSLRAKNLKRTYQNFDIQLTDKEIVDLRSLKSDLVKLIKDAKTVYINTCEHFYGDQSFLGYLLPKPAVVEEVNRRLDLLAGHKYCGVHIRRGDNELAKQQSPTIDFVEMLKKIEKEHQDMHFYLSTDDKGEARIMQKMIGDKLHSFAAGQRRDNPKNIETALVDMLVLAKSERILGSYWSSFSEVAAQYGGIPLVVVKKED